MDPKEIAAELVWVEGINMYNGKFNEYGGMRTCNAYSVSGYNVLTVKSTGTSQHAAPTVGSVVSADATTYTPIPNNEGSMYMGGSYPNTVTYDISMANLIRIKLNSNANPSSNVLS
jgi:phage-related protein